jgi:hypothetical protein
VDPGSGAMTGKSVCTQYNFAISKSSANIPPGSLNCVIYAFYFVQKLIDCHDEAFLEAI